MSLYLFTVGGERDEIKNSIVNCRALYIGSGEADGEEGGREEFGVVCYRVAVPNLLHEGRGSIERNQFFVY